MSKRFPPRSLRVRNDPFSASSSRRLVTSSRPHDGVAAAATEAGSAAAAPALFYADWVHPIDAAHSNVVIYRARLLARPSVKRVVDDARPFRSYFPGGAPDRD